MDITYPGMVVPLTFAADASVAYQPRLLGDVVVTPQTDAPAGQPVSCIVPGAAALAARAPKETARAWTQGVKLYWDNGNSRWTDNSAAAGVKAGAVAAAAATADASTGSIILLSGL